MLVDQVRDHRIRHHPSDRTQRDLEYGQKVDIGKKADGESSYNRIHRLPAATLQAWLPNGSQKFLKLLFRTSARKLWDWESRVGKYMSDACLWEGLILHSPAPWK